MENYNEQKKLENPQKNAEKSPLFVPIESVAMEELKFTSDTPFKDYAEDWFKRNQNTLSPKTRERYKTLLVRIFEGIGHFPLGEIKPRTLETFYAKLAADGINMKTGKTLSATTIYHHHKLVTRILSEAVREEILQINYSDRQHLKAPSRDDKEMEFLDENQVEIFINLLEGEMPKWETIAILLLYLGLRREEVLGLEWRDIDFDKKIIHIRRASCYTVVDGIYTKEPKTKTSARPMRMSPKIFDTLIEYKKWYNLQDDIRAVAEYRLFVQKNGSPMHPDSVSDFFCKFSKKNHLRVNAKMLRHTFVTLMIYNNVNIKQVSYMAGHAQTSTTLNIYTHAVKTAEAMDYITLEKVLGSKN